MYMCHCINILSMKKIYHNMVNNLGVIFWEVFSGWGGGVENYFCGVLKPSIEDE